MQKEHTFDPEVYEVFLEQLADEADAIEKALNLLDQNKEYEESINRLFRIFHSLKANSGYFHFYDFKKLATKVESVLNALRDSAPPLSQSIQEWLDNVLVQYLKWVDELQSGADKLTPVDQKLLDKVHICETTNEDPLALLKGYKLHYFHDKKEVS